MEGLQLKKAVSPADIGVITRLATGIWREHYESTMENGQIAYMLGKFQSENALAMQILQGAVYKIAYYQGRPMGYYGIQEQGEKVLLLNLYLEKAFRRKGIGREILEDILSQCQGKERLELTVTRNNQAAVAAYERMGFVLEGERDTDIGAGYQLEEYVMSLPLVSCGK